MELLRGAVEPAYFTVATSPPLANPPAVEFDENGTAHPSVWADPETVRPRRLSVDVAHPSVTPPPPGAVPLSVGTHRARLHIVEGGRVYVRPTPDTVVVKP